MKKKRTSGLFLGLLLSFIIALPIVAQDGNNPTVKPALGKVYSPTITAAPILSITPDARSAGMAQLGMTHSADIFSLYHNVSMLPRVSKQWGIAAAYTPWMADLVKDMSLSYLGGYYHWEEGNYSFAVGSSFRYFHIGEVLAFPKRSQDPIKLHPYELAADVGFGVGIGKNWSVGMSVRYAYSDYNYSTTEGNATAGTLLMDISGTYQTNINLSNDRKGTLRTALAVNNIGGKMSFDGGRTYLFSPAVLRLGVGLESVLTSEHSLGVHMQASKLMVPSFPTDEKYLNGYYSQSALTALFSSFGDAEGGVAEEFSEIEWGIGAEYRYYDMLWLRGGYRYQNPQKGSNSGYSLGLGVKYEQIKLDVAYFIASRADSPLNRTLRLTLGIDF